MLPACHRSVAVLHLISFLGVILYFMLWHRCAHGLVWFEHKKTLLGSWGKDEVLAWKMAVQVTTRKASWSLSPQTRLEIVLRSPQKYSGVSNSCCRCHRCVESTFGSPSLPFYAMFASVGERHISSWLRVEFNFGKLGLVAKVAAKTKVCVVDRKLNTPPTFWSSRWFSRCDCNKCWNAVLNCGHWLDSILACSSTSILSMPWNETCDTFLTSCPVCLVSWRAVVDCLHLEKVWRRVVSVIWHILKRCHCVSSPETETFTADILILALGCGFTVIWSNSMLD